MFAKLLKYDMKSISKAGVPTLIGVGALTLLGLITSVLFVICVSHINMVFEAYDIAAEAGKEIFVKFLDVASFASVLITIALFAATVGIISLFNAFPVVITVITVLNFYKTLVTDEGYLTFTLPVHPLKILTSKLVNSVVWNIIVSVATTIGSFIIFAPFLLLFVRFEKLASFFSPMAESLVFSVEWYDVLGLISNTLLSTLLSLATLVTTQLLYFLAVFLGGVVAKKHKLLAGGGFIIAGLVAFEIIKGFISFMVMVGTMVLSIIGTLITTLLFPGFEFIITTMFIPNISNLFNLLAFTLIGGGFFAITGWLMTKKLNLP